MIIHFKARTHITLTGGTALNAEIRCSTGPGHRLLPTRPNYMLGAPTGGTVWMMPWCPAKFPLPLFGSVGGAQGRARLLRPPHGRVMALASSAPASGHNLGLLLRYATEAMAGGLNHPADSAFRV